jgi:hypothetical protein
MNEIEVGVKYEPLKEIVILQRNYFPSPDDLARFASVVAGGKTVGLYWAEGVVFLYFLLPASTETTAKILIEKGRAYWTLVGHALMPKYQPIVETKEKLMVPVIDLSSDPIVKKVASWLKQQK